MIRWWHARVLGHAQTERRVTVPVFDPWARGILVRCKCGRTWAL